jgi:hypothetical protein
MDNLQVLSAEEEDDLVYVPRDLFFQILRLAGFGTMSPAAPVVPADRSTSCPSDVVAEMAALKTVTMQNSSEDSWRPDPVTGA